MQYEVESSDSEMMAFTPRLSRTRSVLKPSHLVDSPKSFEPNNRDFNRAELEEAYRRLETPKSSSQSQPRPPRTGDSFGGREVRMRLQNIIDSEANDTEEENQLMLSPATMKILDSSQSALPLASTTPKARPVKFMKEDDSYTSDLTDNTGDLIAEFSRKSQTAEFRNASPTKFLRDDLEQSRTRFRQSINELLNSSPIQASKQPPSAITAGGHILKGNSNPIDYTNAGASFRAMVQEGSKLSAQVLAELEELERQAALSTSTNGSLSLQNLSPDGMYSDEEQLVDDEAGTNRSKKSSVFWILFRRIFVSLLILGFFLLFDTIIQGFTVRKQLGLPLIPEEWSHPFLIVLERLEKYFPSIQEYTSRYIKQIQYWIARILLIL